MKPLWSGIDLRGDERSVKEGRGEEKKGKGQEVNIEVAKREGGDKGREKSRKEGKELWDYGHVNEGTISIAIMLYLVLE